MTASLLAERMAVISGRSEIYILQKLGASILPWGTPERIRNIGEKEVPWTTRQMRSIKCDFLGLGIKTIY